jgi:hypothetical protein
MKTTVGAFMIAVCMVASGATPVDAQSPGGRTVLWTVVGAGAGFGLGMIVGLTAFDDAINSERKILATALATAAAGGTLGYLVTRDRQSRGPASPTRTHASLTGREIEALARAVSLRSLRPGSPSVVQFADADASARPF